MTLSLLTEKDEQKLKANLTLNQQSGVTQDG
ncbi:hypothetical protein MADE_000001022645 [Alteromonas mediterranea DE]|jgi:hypothetical protein|uniref:Uncharacterized protein n=1 Tax=Alteromonas mediterranea (strain DSM 17117 / CIP 110805 / LMG 28347 / Deep ecotype) TaxID=1774373 RepID=T2DMD2_ALTMD|nr:hypothetical protein MADE_000001022645 [Alteromonas mediterranea DE]